jgi:ubiquinone/menaquinone biosynthesis C-methylase UbiE
MNETRFKGIGDIYAKYRPSYPQTFIEYLYSDVGISKDSIIADIGSGTGILTKQLLEAGSKVMAVEPNDDMRIVAEADLKNFEKFISINATAENTKIYDSTVDFITVARAFHWFDQTIFKKECGRILKQNGKIIIVFDAPDASVGIAKEDDEINRKYCPNFKVSYSSTSRFLENDIDNFFTDEYETKIFQNDQIYDLDGFIGRNLSRSSALKKDEKNYPAYIAELTMSFNKHAVNGKVVMPNVTVSYKGTV